MAFFVFTGILAQGQNLVPNPSFEEYTACPFYGGDLHLATGWTTPTSSSDFYHSCSIHPWWGTPTNLGGYQIPKSGNGYAGFFVYAPQNTSTPNQKEYMETELLSALEKDSFYQVKLYASLTNDSRYACDCIEVWFTPHFVKEPGYDTPGHIYVSHLIEGYPQLATPEGFFLADTANWMELCWIYKAKGGEKFMTIGSFKENLSVSVITMPPSIPSSGVAYYYLDDISVEKIPQHIANTGLGEDITVCGAGITDTLLVQGAYTQFLWSTGDTGQSIVLTEPGQYWVEASMDGCFIRDTVEYIEQQLLSMDLGPDTTFCPGGNIRIHAADGFGQYLWSTGETTTAIEIENYGEYWVEASYACGTQRDTIVVDGPPPLAIFMPDGPALRLGEEVRLSPQISAGSPVTYQWTPPDWLDCPDCREPWAKPSNSILYTLSIEDGFGCSTSDSIFISVENIERVYIPNVFSPNGDLVNDVFAVYGGPEVWRVASLKIFDRWGEMVFHAENLPPDGSSGWDGTFDGINLGPGVFVYLAEVTFLDGAKKKFSGSFSLVK